MEDRGLNWRFSIFDPQFSILNPRASLREAYRLDINPSDLDLASRAQLHRNRVAVQRKLFAPEIAATLESYSNRVAIAGRRANLRRIVGRDDGVALRFAARFGHRQAELAGRIIARERTASNRAAVLQRDHEPCPAGVLRGHGRRKYYCNNRDDQCRFYFHFSRFFS